MHKDKKQVKSFKLQILSNIRHITFYLKLIT